MENRARLLAEDERLSRRTAEAALRKQGYKALRLVLLFDDLSAECGFATAITSLGTIPCSGLLLSTSASPLPDRH